MPVPGIRLQVLLVARFAHGEKYAMLFSGFYVCSVPVYPVKSSFMIWQTS